MKQHTICSVKQSACELELWFKTYLNVSLPIFHHFYQYFQSNSSTINHFSFNRMKPKLKETRSYCADDLRKAVHDVKKVRNPKIYGRGLLKFDLHASKCK